MSRDRSRSPYRNYRYEEPYYPERRDRYSYDYDYREPYRGYGYDRYDRYNEPHYRKRTPIRGTENERESSSCLFVGNLPYSFIEADVRDMFQEFGRIENVSVPMDRYTGKNKGFAFITYEQRQDAEQAKSKYDQYTIEGRRIRIDWDIGRERKERPREREHRDHDPRERDRDREYRDPRDRDSREIRERDRNRDDRDPRDFRDPREERDPRDYRDPREEREPRDYRDPREDREPREFRDPRDERDPRNFREERDPYRDPQESRGDPRDLD